MRFFKNTKYKIVIFLAACLTTSATLTSCKKDTVNTVAVYEQKEQIGKKIKELSDLLAASTFGFKKDMYPTESKILLDAKIDELKKLLEDIKTQVIPPQNVASETALILTAVANTQSQFISSKRTENYVRNGILHVNGKDGGYIDFGSHPEFSNFNDGPFTVELWSKVIGFGGFDFLLSTFVDNFLSGNDKIFQGWGVNYNGGNMRMTYALDTKDIYEPPINNYNTQYTGEWVHLAFVWNPDKTDDGSGNPKTFKMYVNGELRKEEDWRSTNYTPNTINTHMYGFASGSFGGGALTDRGTNGYMKNMNVWKSLKTQAQIQNIKDNPESVVGTESDLVCGWRLTEVALDNNDIPDITGRYTAKLFGNFDWIENP